MNKILIKPPLLYLRHTLATFLYHVYDRVIHVNLELLTQSRSKHPLVRLVLSNTGPLAHLCVG